MKKTIRELQKFKLKAENLAKNEELLKTFLSAALEKVKQNKGKIDDFLNDLKTLIRLIRAWSKKEYRTIPWKSLIAAIAAVLYFLNPFDLIPDFLFFGFVDDAYVISKVFSSIRVDLKQFSEWEKTRQS